MVVGMIEEGFQMVCSGIGWTGWTDEGSLAMGGGRLAEFARRVSIVCRALLSITSVFAWQLQGEIGACCLM